MAEQGDKAKEQQNQGSGGGRSVNYPYITLEHSIKQAQKIWDAVGKGNISVVSAGKTWGYDEKSSATRSTVSALKQFGLLQDIGGGDSREVRLTDRALDILHPHDPANRDSAIQAAAMGPKIYGDIFAKFPMGIPTQDHIISAYLLRDKEFNRKVVDGFINNFRANLTFAKIPSSGKMPQQKDSEAKDEDSPKIRIGDFIQWDAGGVLQLPQPSQVTRISPDGKFLYVEGSDAGIPIAEAKAQVLFKPGTAALGMTGFAPQVIQKSFKQDIYTLGEEGQVILQWPEKMSQASYDELVEWIDLQKRKIARLNGIEIKK